MPRPLHTLTRRFLLWKATRAGVGRPAPPRRDPHLARDIGLPPDPEPLRWPDPRLPF